MKHGFTLIELSIVLVVIGLIVGGVLVGRDLIHTAEIRATIKQVEDFNTAVNTFRVKYNCLPGDCSQIGQFGFDTTYVGNGNNIVGFCEQGGGSCADSGGGSLELDPNHIETFNFWYHLSAASFISYTFPPYDPSRTDYQDWYAGGKSSPPAKIKARILTYRGNSYPLSGWVVRSDMPYMCEFSGCSADPDPLPSHHWVLTNGRVGGGIAAPLAGMYLASDLYAIDRKIDDGQPTTGSARAFTSTMGASFPYAVYTAQDSTLHTCITNTSPPQYDMTYPPASEFLQLGAQGCAFLIKATF